MIFDTPSCAAFTASAMAELIPGLAIPKPAAFNGPPSVGDKPSETFVNALLIISLPGTA